MTNAPCTGAAFTDPRRPAVAAEPMSVPMEAGADRSAAWKGQLCWGLVALACWFFFRQYQGVVGDSRIYMGRALADLSPATVGRDLMFVHDGQSSFSLFPLLTRVLVQHLGAPFAAAAIAWVGMCLWAASFIALAFRLAPPRTAWAMLIFVALLPSAYGGFLVFATSEAAALPRPFAEAFVLAALWAALSRRRGATIGFLLAAALFHPIMALCGVCVILAMMALEDKRWGVAGAVGLALTLLAGLIGLPLASRLFQHPDAQWLEVLRQRNAYLFPTLWPLAAWISAFVQFATLGMTALLLKGRARALFICVGIVGLGGLAATLIAGDLFPNLLVLQMQPWRALWLVNVFATAGAAVCCATLLKRGSWGQITVVLLYLSWLLIDSPGAIVLSTLAVSLAAKPATESPLGPRLAKAAWVILIAYIAYQAILDAAILPPILKASSPEASLLTTLDAVTNFKLVILAPLTVWLLLNKRRIGVGFREWPVLLASATALVAALICWNAAPASKTFRGVDARLIDMLHERSGAVQWINGDTQAWTLANRASWGSGLQGASIVFTREQALGWRTRVERLLALHLISAHSLKPRDASRSQLTPPHTDVLRPSAASLTSLCATPGGPAWIISPVVREDAPPAMPGVRLWEAPFVSYLRATTTTTSATYVPVTTYAVIPCGQASPPRAPAEGLQKP